MFDGFGELRPVATLVLPVGVSGKQPPAVVADKTPGFERLSGKLNAGAAFLGPNAIIGDDVVIGGNVWVTSPVASGTTIATASPEQNYKKGNDNGKKA